MKPKHVLTRDGDTKCGMKPNLNREGTCRQQRQQSQSMHQVHNK